jgi:hypothetical protein
VLFTPPSSPLPSVSAPQIISSPINRLQISLPSFDLSLIHSNSHSIVPDSEPVVEPVFRPLSPQGLGSIFVDPVGSYPAFIKLHGHVHLDSPFPNLPRRKEQDYDRPCPAFLDEYTVDSVVWDVRIHLQHKWVLRYLVRWYRWEDEFNTIEPEYRLCRTFAFWQFKNPGQVIGIGDGLSSRALRSSPDNIPLEETEVLHQSGDHYLSLLRQLKISVKTKRYTKCIGFHGYYNLLYF